MKPLSAPVGVLVAGLLLSAAACRSGPAADPRQAQYEAALTPFLSANAIPGVSYAVFSKDTVLHAGAVGVADRATDRSASAGDVYHWFSISKLIATVAVMQLVEAGKIELDDALVKHLPDYRGKHSCGRAPTLRDMLSHKSGIPDDLLQLARLAPAGEKIPTVAEMTRTQLDRALTSCPGTTIRYANMNFLLLGRVVELVAKQTYTAYVAERILEPLGLQDVAFAFNPALRARVSTGHLLNGDFLLVGLRAALGAKADRLFPRSDDTYHEVAPFDVPGKAFAGAIGNAGQMAIFARSIVGESSPLLSRASLAQMRRPQSIDPKGSGAESSYGLGWSLGFTKSMGAIGHTGGGPGYGAALYWFADLKLGVAALANLNLPGEKKTELARIFKRIYAK